MASITCPSCFASAVYTYEKPKFCGKCGKNYATGFVVETPKPQKRPSIANDLRNMPSAHTYQEEYGANPEEVYGGGTYFDPMVAAHNKSKWKQRLAGTVQVEDDSQKRKVTILDVAVQGGVERAPENKTAEQVMAEIQKENGSIKSAPFELRDTSNDVPQVIGQ